MKKTINKSTAADSSLNRASRNRHGENASFPIPPGKRELPENYAAVLDEIKKRILTERLRMVMSANATIVLLYWDIGRMILDRQEKEGWGTRVIDRL